MKRPYRVRPILVNLLAIITFPMLSQAQDSTTIAKPNEPAVSQTAGDRQAVLPQGTTQAQGVDQTSSWTDPLSAAEGFYQASTTEFQERALNSLRTQWPEHPLRWEVETMSHWLASRQAQMSMSALSAFEHILSAETDTDEMSYASELWPLVVRSISFWPLHQRQEIAHRLLEVIKAYPDHRVKASLAWSARHITHFSRFGLGYELSTEILGPMLPLSIIGTWDNDQGKGLDTVYPPEEGIDFAGRYHGKLTEISWRTSYPLDQRGKIDLGELLAPNEWQVAYAVSAFEVKEATQAELRVSTTDPVKVWLNGELVIHTTRVNGWLFDAITLPIQLRSGVNQVLIKSAQQQGSWMLAARLTAVGGGRLEYEARSGDQKIASPLGTTPVSTPMAEEEIRASIEQRFREGAPARRAFHTLFLLDEAGLPVERLSYAEEVHTRFPTSIMVKLSLASALWDNGERGRAADLFSDLFQLAQGDPRASSLIDWQARFWRQQRLDVKAREVARELIKSQPELPAAYRLYADLLAQKGWHEERCQALYIAEKFANDHSLQSAIASCEESSGRHHRARARRHRLWSLLPLLTTSLDGRFTEALSRRDQAGMLAVATDCLEAWPQSSKCYRYRALALWEAERNAEALNALEAWRGLNPLEATPLIIRGEWLLTLGQTEEAIKAWEEAIILDPDNQNLSLRLSELKPKGSEPWLADVPSDDQVRAAVLRREEITPAEGANQVYLLDDEVSLLKGDGSTETVVTQVVHALNQEGRDDLTKMYIGRGHRTQLMAAYAISPDGSRVEASSIRKSVVRFRQLQIGSTVVLQYRSSESPSEYLVGHISKSWWFQNLDTQVIESRWVLWTPLETQVRELAHEALSDQPVEAMQRTEERRGDLKRIMWRMHDLPPIPVEPSMPPLFSQVAGLQISTVPSWDDVFKWERELLRDAFRVSPEVETISAQLFKEGMSAQDKFYAIQDYVSRNIRYQQDYEHTIAGVKPHTAAQVLARQYGDCKDKAVLFITLAQTAGLKADFALVKTRDSGDVQQTIPSQQFNHAIVYVPAQEGFTEGRFFDPTVDALDVQSLRSDDQGTHSLVYDPRRDQHYWQDIPFQPPSFDQSEDRIELKIDEEGRVQGTLTMTSQGKIGQILRQKARNPEGFKQVMQYRVSQLIPGAQMLDHQATRVDDLYTPAEAKINFAHDSWVKREGDQLRLPAPVDWTPKRLFQLEERRFPLVLGHKRQWRWVLNAALPEGFDVSHLPADREAGSDCLRISRSSRWDAATRQLTLTWLYQSLCERLSPEEYITYRPLARDMIQLLNEEVVLSPKPTLKERVPVTP